jgi:type II secretory pathway component GspD/PulD (secretin)
MINKIFTFFLTIICVCSALCQNEPLPEASPTASPVEPEGPPALATPTSSPNDSVVDEIERLLRERENAEAAAAARMQPSQPRTHRYTNQPLARVLRILAEQAGINYIEPNLPVDERISVTLTNLTPLQAFYDIAQSRGFQVVTDGVKYTLRRSDIISPSFFLTKRYPIHNQPAEFLLQPIANLLGIKAAPASENNPAYPKPANVRLSPDALASSTATGSDQSQPRFQPGLPFDAPLSVGGYNKEAENAVFLERSSNSLVVRATPDGQSLVAAELERLDRRERQILIKTYVVEISDTNGIGGGVDWSQALGLQPGQGASFKLQGNPTNPTSDILGKLTPGAFFTNGLILDVSNIQVVIQALKQRGRLRSNNSPMTVAKSGVPVTIRSDTKQTIFLQTPGTQLYGPSTTPYTFTTGLTIDIVARVLDDGLVDMNLNPTLSSVAGSSPAQPGTTTTVPIISTRSTTANITVHSGQAAVIGGILQDSNQFNQNGIPGISRIPIVGYLFKTKSTTNARTNLIVIVSPTVIPAANQRRDRLGESEREILSDSSDLPGEPPPLPLEASGKQVRGLKTQRRQ